MHWKISLQNLQHHSRAFFCATLSSSCFKQFLNDFPELQYIFAPKNFAFRCPNSPPWSKLVRYLKKSWNLYSYICNSYFVCNLQFQGYKNCMRPCCVSAVGFLQGCSLCPDLLQLWHAPPFSSSFVSSNSDLDLSELFLICGLNMFVAIYSHLPCACCCYHPPCHFFLQCLIFHLKSHLRE